MNVRTPEVQVRGRSVINTCRQSEGVAHLTGPVVVKAVIATTVSREHQEAVWLQNLVICIGNRVLFRRIKTGGCVNVYSGKDLATGISGKST